LFHTGVCHACSLSISKQAVKQNSKYLTRLLTTENVTTKGSSESSVNAGLLPRPSDDKDAEAVRQANYNLYSVARHLLSNLAVVAVVDPLELSLNCKPLLTDIRCSVRTNAPISCTLTIGCRVSVDASGNIVDDGEDSYLEYSVLSIVAPGTQAAPIIQARIAVVRSGVWHSLACCHGLLIF
jgi:hypothetical protein